MNGRVKIEQVAQLNKLKHVKQITGATTPDQSGHHTTHPNIIISVQRHSYSILLAKGDICQKRKML
jgi:hypothetical protein